MARASHEIPESSTDPRKLVAVLAVAVLAISSAAVLVRAIQDADSLAIALWRSGIVAVVLAPTVRGIERRDALRIFFAGAFLAAHFATWFASLSGTTVMRSTVLVCAAPIWAGFLEWAFLGRRPPRGFFVGLGLAIPGVALLAGSGGGESTLVGDLLALVGGQCGAAYWVLGRSVRTHVGIGTYASLVCAAAAVVLLPACLVTGVALVGFSTETWLLIAALALGPQLLGHNGFNYALRYLPAATVSAITLLEPVGATLLAMVLFGELPPALGVLGAAITVVGVAQVARTTTTPPRAAPAAASTRPR